MTQQTIAYCGLVCIDCPAYLATQAGDHQKALETAELWSRHYNLSIKVDDVWCDGCLVGGRKWSHCAECEIRTCAQKRGVKNCAHCDDYLCDVLSNFFKAVPEAQKTLDRIRQTP